VDSINDTRVKSNWPFLAVVRILGIVVTLFSLTMLVPVGVAMYYNDAALIAYDEAIIITAVCGILITGLTWWHKRELYPRDGFLLVALVWAVLPIFAAIPFLRYFPEITFAQAYFEAASGLTTSGGTVLVGLDDMPQSILIWRALLQWLGGMGILILALAILPLLGVGGMQIYRAEMAGPIKDSKLTPRIAETAKLLYGVYLFFSIACFFAYWAAGMTPFDAVVHTGSTMALGGLSSHDASFGYFNSPAIEWVAIIFMLIAGVNFVVHAVALRHMSIRSYVHDAQARWFWFVSLGGSLVVGIFLFLNNVYPTFIESMRHALFNTVAVATTTGYSTQDYSAWPAFAPWFMVFLSAFATSSGSPGSGIKMIRLLLLIKQARRELLRIIHPRVISPVQLGDAPVSNQVIFAVLAYMLFYGATVMVSAFLLLISGMDPITAMSAALASVNNLGPGLGEVGPAGNYANLTSFQLWVCSITMLLGRLELLTLLVVLTPAFWKN
jgi:trk system potassium uptake protein TrkH